MGAGDVQGSYGGEFGGGGKPFELSLIESVSGLVDDGFDHADGLGVERHIVHALDVSPLLPQPGAEGDGGPLAGLELSLAGESAEEGFAGDADEQGAGTDAEGGQMTQEREVVFEVFAEAEAGIQRDAPKVDPGFLDGLEAALEVVAHVLHDVVIMRVLLHGLGAALHVHDHETSGGFGGDLEHAGVAIETGDVIDDVGSGGEGGTGDLGFHGIDG